MKLAFVFLCVVACALAAPKPRAACDPSKCKLPDCRCTGTDIPGGLKPEETPQLVYLTFDDAVTAINYEYYKKVFFDRKNPDGCPVSTTYFVSHEYTDYSLVHQLRARGHEIALHSISHTSLTDYWKKIAVDDLVLEFGGEKELISTFADIKKEDIKGLRLPLLQLSGDNTFLAMQKSGLTWDCSWPTRTYTEPGLWPYSLDYGHSQDCPITPCPSSDLALKGIWISPMVMWFDDKDVACSMVDACTNIPEDVDGILKFMIKNFEMHYNGNRAPFGAYMHAAWFGQRENAWPAYEKFIDYLQTKKDVYIVSVSRGLEWVRNPKKIGEKLWPSCQNTFEPACKKPISCKLNKGNEERYMKVCGQCPDVYPWLGNPTGAK